jgi:hypothetical protein
MKVLIYNILCRILHGSLHAMEAFFAASIGCVFLFILFGILDMASFGHLVGFVEHTFNIKVTSDFIAHLGAFVVSWAMIVAFLMGFILKRPLMLFK